MATVIQVKRGTAAAWTSANTVLTVGEIGFESDTKKMKVGDGSTAWTSLAYTATDGDITAVVAGTGLSGGSTSGSATLSIDTATTVDKTTAQTLTNKTLTSPVLTTPSISTMTTTGDILYASSANTPARLGIGTTGQNLVVASGVPSWATPAVAASGMTFITRSTASAVATVTLDSIFTSTYDTYLVVVERLLNSAGAALYLQLRYGSSTETANYYGTSVNFAATQTQVTATGAIQSTVASQTHAGQTSSFAIWFNQVGNASEGANWHGTGQSGGLGPGAPFVYGGWELNSRTYTGIIFSSASGNITGEFSVYGLAKA